jgi:hypothetical protein
MVELVFASTAPVTMGSVLMLLWASQSFTVSGTAYPNQRENQMRDTDIPMDEPPLFGDNRCPLCLAPKLLSYKPTPLAQT